MNITEVWVGRFKDLMNKTKKGSIETKNAAVNLLQKLMNILIKIPIGEYLKKYSPVFGALFLVASIFSFASSRYVDAYVVSVDKEELGIVKNTEIFDKNLSELENSVSRLSGVKVSIDRNKLELTKEKVNIHKISSIKEIKDKLLKQAPILVNARVITINGSETISVANDTEAKEVLDYYRKDALKDERYSYVGFADKVEINEVNERPAEIKSYYEALNTLDSTNALVIETREKIEYQEDIPFEEIVEWDSTMLSGSRELLARGMSGKKTVDAYVVKHNGEEVNTEVISEKVIQEPVDERIAIGTGSFEDLYFTGVINWPIYGSVTSRFGSRWGSVHTGIDISGYTGEPIYAADGGVVIWAGWDGDYGYLIKIAHINNTVTWYGHCSKIYVDAGDKVKKGEVIGLVGSTGFSTGPHLHFEVRRNGVANDPFNYLD